MPPCRQVTRVSRETLRSSSAPKADVYSHMLVEWGQFVDHDISFTPQSSSAASPAGVDCLTTCENIHPCFPIEVRWNRICFSYISDAFIIEAHKVTTGFLLGCIRNVMICVMVLQCGSAIQVAVVKTIAFLLLRQPACTAACLFSAPRPPVSTVTGLMSNKLCSDSR